jgi:hypothetical protein
MPNVAENITTIPILKPTLQRARQKKIEYFSKIQNPSLMKLEIPEIYLIIIYIKSKYCTIERLPSFPFFRITLKI